MYTIYKRNTSLIIARSENPIAEMIKRLAGNATLKDVMKNCVIVKDREEK